MMNFYSSLINFSQIGFTKSKFSNLQNAVQKFVFDLWPPPHPSLSSSENLLRIRNVPIPSLVRFPGFQTSAGRSCEAKSFSRSCRNTPIRFMLFHLCESAAESRTMRSRWKNAPKSFCRETFKHRPAESVIDQVWWNCALLNVSKLSWRYLALNHHQELLGKKKKKNLVQGSRDETGWWNLKQTQNLNFSGWLRQKNITETGLWHPWVPVGFQKLSLAFVP